MESSTVLAFRIFVMLSCLIIVPLAAIFGSAFPDVVKTVLVDRVVAWSTGKSPEATPSADWGYRQEGSSATPAVAVDIPGMREAPRWGTPDSAAAGGWQTPEGHGQQVVSAAATGAGDSPNASLAVISEAPAWAGTARDRATNNAPPGSWPANTPGSAPPHAQAPLESGSPYQMPGAANQPDRFTSMERRLRELGATYYLLETWGQQGELYRFHCQMAIGNNPNFTKHFEATDRDALRAMAQVLADVEQWRSPRIQ